MLYMKIQIQAFYSKADSPMAGPYSKKNVKLFNFIFNSRATYSTVVTVPPYLCLFYMIILG